jgi:hypothetical protein
MLSAISEIRRSIMVKRHSEEYRGMLEAYEVEYDERYVFHQVE